VVEQIKESLAMIDMNAIEAMSNDELREVSLEDRSEYLRRYRTELKALLETSADEKVRHLAKASEGMNDDGDDEWMFYWAVRNRPMVLGKASHGRMKH
jgi:hypothetical protein